MVKDRNVVFWFDENDKLAGWEYDDGTIERYAPKMYGTKIDWAVLL